MSRASGPAAPAPAAADTRGSGLAAHGLFAGLLAMAGLPIYIHAPKFYVDTFGVSLSALAAVLFGLRLLDFVQDPALGWLAARLRDRRSTAVVVAGGMMALAMLGLFAVAPPVAPLPWFAVAPPVAPLMWFALTLTALFSAFSFLTISFYAAGARKGAALGPGGHERVASWRETGALLGVCLAAASPGALMIVSDRPFALFGAGFGILAVVALWAMRHEWARDRAPSDTGSGAGFRAVLGDAQARRLLAIAFVNAAPVAITSTLFLFFVESRLMAPGWEGPLLVLFFLAAAASAPAWARLAQRHGAKRVLLAGMGLAVLAFAAVPLLGAGDVALFALVCALSGAGLGADLTLLSAIFSRRMAAVVPDAAGGFGLWAFVTKATLALAAAIVLPALDIAGFAAGADNSVQALTVLTMLYAGLPCILKLLAMALLAATPITED